MALFAPSDEGPPQIAVLYLKEDLPECRFFRVLFLDDGSVSAEISLFDFNITLGKYT